MATKKRVRAVAAGPTKLAATIFEKWARPGEQMPLEQLESELPDERRYDLVAALRELQKLDAGELHVGGKGHRSRFVWADKSALASVRSQHHLSESAPRAVPTKGKAAKRKAVSAPAPVVQIGGASLPSRPQRPATASEGPLEHAFYVRPGVLATFRLPVDITHTEVERLCQLLQSIPFR